MTNRMSCYCRRVLTIADREAWITVNATHDQIPNREAIVLYEPINSAQMD